MSNRDIVKKFEENTASIVKSQKKFIQYSIDWVERELAKTRKSKLNAQRVMRQIILEQRLITLKKELTDRENKLENAP